MAEKKYVIDNPVLMEEWYWEKNTEFDPTKITLGSGKKAWWKCAKGHEWQATVGSRNSGNGCPYCNNRKVLQGFNDLQTLNPCLASEWNYEKNAGLTPSKVSLHSSIKAWWRCDKGHEWQATIADRSYGCNCPYCSGKKVLTGFNDLDTINPALSLEWNYEKNNGLYPSTVVAGSNKKVWWKCSKGHEWQATISSRNKGVGCPVCNSARSTSFPEYALVYYLDKCGCTVIQSHKDFGYELDIYIPSQKTAIEYDGWFWHRDKVDQDLEKNRKCKRDGIKLYRIREGLHALNDTSLDFVIRKKKEEDLAETIKLITSEIMDMDIDVNLDRDSIEIENLRTYREQERSIVLTNSQIASEWNYEKNGCLKPENYTAGSNKRLWWKCSKGHEWQATIAVRNSGSGCPYCAGRYAVRGIDDLKTANPDFISEWNYEKNRDLNPEDFKLNSNQRVWWKCAKGHEWQALISNRCIGRGCPYCAGQMVIPGINDLQSINPSLAAEWDYDKNDGLTPENVMPNSTKKIWWKCKRDHEWQAIIGNRNKGAGCPFCAGKKAIKGFNDLKTVNPTLAAEWNYEKNLDLLPENMLPNSGKKVWWKCSKGHEWQATIAHRNHGRGCPYCSGRKKK